MLVKALVSLLPPIHFQPSVFYKAVSCKPAMNELNAEAIFSKKWCRVTRVACICRMIYWVPGKLYIYIYVYRYISFLNAFLVYVNCKLYWNPAGSEAVFVFGAVSYNISCLDGMDTRIQMFQMLSARTLPPDQSSFGKQIHANLTYILFPGELIPSKRKCLPKVLHTKSYWKLSKRMMEEWYSWWKRSCTTWHV